ncbi:hypothetical protein BCR32DRAFT_274367 [Anaeromyces robustus]|uniref:Uncharacterized protein n=1 Tax=Anaeromyces robustus TaxID=1754192 RepID=A0A1Y1XPY4_9FUNG|nr:hypothetical protein BCR32DRAFT_274367 [Anaeromyces robustus]|eukprot:ORX87576.1 hypothetical protein BCR32DRAFT_274367 [Anaeromyces robustus]
MFIIPLLFSLSSVLWRHLLSSKVITYNISVSVVNDWNLGLTNLTSYEQLKRNDNQNDDTIMNCNFENNNNNEIENENNQNIDIDKQRKYKIIKIK